MDIIVNLAEGFMGLFDAGAETFVGWVTSIVPRVLLLLIFMNALIALIGQERINKFAKVCSGNVILAYGILPFLSAFMLGNPMALSMGKFLPERMKPSYYMKIYDEIISIAGNGQIMQGICECRSAKEFYSYMIKNNAFFE